jgi:hypothetical protein
MKILTSLSIALVVGLAGCNLSSADSVKGSGIIKTEKRTLAPFYSLNRNKEDWHRQFLSGTTVFVKKTVPGETVCAFNYPT